VGTYHGNAIATSAYERTRTAGRAWLWAPVSQDRGPGNRSASSPPTGAPTFAHHFRSTMLRRMSTSSDLTE
jgi:hypothetical protein